MKTVKTEVNIYNQSTEDGLNSLQSHIEHHKNSIQDIIQLGKYSIIVSGCLPMANYHPREQLWHGLDVNIAIAGAITAGARMVMSKVKNSSEFDLYYTDTDSIVINKPLPAEMVGPSLGQFKLEHIIKEAVFLAPKVYGFITEDGSETVKIKGVAKEQVSRVTVNDLGLLLIDDSKHVFQQHKWYKNVFKGSITIAEVAYELKATSNKRCPEFTRVLDRGGNVHKIYTHSTPYHYDQIIKVD